jgi:hypothetical protein
VDSSSSTGKKQAAPADKACGEARERMMHGW